MVVDVGLEEGVEEREEGREELREESGECGVKEERWGVEERVIEERVE
tara:strand:- start:517 stop:660 length:144 start_codon:yes stop_codon:yes gene_type:complete